jgi:hypothetical protein
MSPPTSSQVHDRLEALIREGTAGASRADGNATQLALSDLQNGGLLDEHTVAFLRRARTLVLGLTGALAAVVDAHRATPETGSVTRCRECGSNWHCWTLRHCAEYQIPKTGPIGRSEAWHRADLHLNAGKNESALLAVEEFDRGFIARPVHIKLPAPPSTPTLDEQVLVIDKADGSLTRWPLMHLPTIEAQYALYKQNRPMTLRRPAGTPEYR